MEEKNIDKELKVEDISRSLSQELIAEPLIRYRDIHRQLTSGITPTFNPDQNCGIEVSGKEYLTTTYSSIIYQVKAIPLEISCLRELIILSKPTIKYNSFIDWGTKYKDNEDKNKYPFDKFECDYNKLLKELDTLNYYRRAVIHANRTTTLKDDFVLIKDNGRGSTDLILTQNLKIYSRMPFSLTCFSNSSSLLTLS